MALFGAPTVQGGRETPETEFFPVTGLSALYKCDELDGSLLFDATGNRAAMVPYSGVALDCATTTQYIVDGTGLRAAMNGLSVNICCGLSVIMPALGAGTPEYIIAGTATSTGGGSGIQVAISQPTGGFASTTDRWAMTIVTRLNLDGGGAAQYTFSLTNSNFEGLIASTGYEIVFTVKSAVGLLPTLTLHYRAAGSLLWTEKTVTTGTAPTTSAVIAEGGTSVYRVGCYGTASNPFKGRILNAFVAHDASLTIADLKRTLLTPTLTNVQDILGTVARFWSFYAGTGTNAHELVTDAQVAITGASAAWSTGLSGCQQLCMGQGEQGLGKTGVKFGGETGFTTAGLYAQVDTGSNLITQGAGWTMIATLRAGDTLPAAARMIVSINSTLKAGGEAATAILTHGVHFVYTSAGGLSAYVKRAAAADGDSAAAYPMGEGDRYSSNGEFCTYAISCSAAGAIKIRRMSRTDTSVTTVSTSTANTANLHILAPRVRIGDPALDCDIVAAFFGIYNRELTDAEVALWQGRSGSMYGAEIHVDAAAAAAGNGTERFPYASLQSALRVHQPAGKIYLNGGSANQRIASDYSASSVLRPASLAGMELVGTNDPVIATDLGDSQKYPLFLEENASGTWIFRDIIFDPTDATIPPVVGPPAFTGGAASGAAVILDGIQRLEMYGCTTKNAVKSDTSNGTGLTSRAIENVIHDHTSIDNEEHAAYFRIAAASSAVPHTFDVQNFTASGNGEDGIKSTNEFSDGSTTEDPTPARAPVYWEDIVLDRIHITGGKNQILLDGVKRGTLTNFLCEAEDGGLATTAGLSLGASYAYGQVESLTIANGTIRDYGTTDGYAVKNTNSTGCTATNIVTGSCFADLYDPNGTLTSSYCSGDSGHATLLWPDANNNQPDASITFDDTDDAHISSGDGFEDGANLWTTSTLLRTDLAGDDRPESGAWNRGAY